VVAEISSLIQAGILAQVGYRS